MSKIADHANCLDNAFAGMISKSEQILAFGRPGSNFNDLLPPPVTQRVVCDFDMVEPVSSAPQEMEARQLETYAPLVAEFKRFEPQTVLFTSLEPGQGVTYTAHNIMRCWEKDPVKKSLLLELYNGVSGLGEYDLPYCSAREIAQEPQALESCLRYFQAEDFYLLSAHAPGAAAFTGGMWKRLVESFDFIVIDCSPYWHNALAPRLAPLCDGTVLMSTRKPDAEIIKRFTLELKEQQARFMGVLLNAQ